MEQGKAVLLLLSVAVISVQSSSLVKRGIVETVVYGRCPEPSDLAPYCECSVNVYVATVQISCQNLPNAKELKSTLSQSLGKKNFDWLYITKSNLTSVPSGLLGKNSFSGILVSQNEIGKIDNNAFAESSMYALWVAYNKMASFNFRSLDALSKLREVTLLGNQLTEIPEDSFANLVSLQSIALDENRISDLEPGAFKNLPELRRISLDKNNLTRLRSGIFNGTGTKHSVFLTLTNNRIQRIEAGALDGLSLEVLDLRYNQLDTVSRDAFENILNSMCVEKGSYIHLGDNPIQCDVRLLWLVKKSRDCKKHIRSLSCVDGRNFDTLSEDNLTKSD